MHYINKNVRDQVQYFFFFSHQLLTFIANVCLVYLSVHRIETVVWASKYDFGLVARKPVFGGLWSTQSQTSLRISAVWSAPLLFAFWKVSNVNMLHVNFNLLAGLCSWGTGLKLAFSETPKTGFLASRPIWYILFKYQHSNIWIKSLYMEQFVWRKVYCNSKSLTSSWWSH